MTPADVRSTVVGVLVACAVMAPLVGCGQGEPTAAGSGGDSAEMVGCDEGVAPIVDLLTEGTPTYDYDPYVDLPELIDASDEIVTGTMLSAQRVIAPEPEDPEDRPMLDVQVGETLALKPTGDSTPASFAYDAVWAFRNEPDPLAEPVTFDPARLRFLAFLVEHQGRFTPHVQGLVVACDPEQPAVPIFDPPPGTDGMTIDEIEAAVVAVTDPPPPTENVVTVPHRVLAEDLDYGDAYTTTQLTAQQVWAVAPDAEVDIDNEVFLEFNVAEPGNCPNGPLDRIEYNPDTGRLYPVLEPHGFDACHDDDNPHVIIVAITRQDLPADAFTATTGPDDNVGGLDDGYASFEPGELRAPAPEVLEHPVLRESSPLAVGDTGIILDVSTHCGLERLFHPVDGRQWVLTDESAAEGLPAAWDDVTRVDVIDLIVERAAEDRLVVTARGTADSMEYRPADDEEGCA